MVLIKEMIFAIVHGEAVGIVHPAYPGGQMEDGTLIIADKRGILLLVFPGFLKYFGHWEIPPSDFRKGSRTWADAAAEIGKDYLPMKRL
jgi:hypothetical protein